MSEENGKAVITGQTDVEFEEEQLPSINVSLGDIPRKLAVYPKDANAKSQACNPLDLPSDVFNAGLERRKENRRLFMAWVRSALVDNVDFGKVKTKRGMSRASLRKPGAEKICGMLGVTAHFPTLPEYERAAFSGIAFENIILRCELKDATGRVVAEGVGARSLKEDYGDINKAMKMAEKSAMIDATLRMGGLSELFTQDLEDMKPDILDGRLGDRSGTARGVVVQAQYDTPAPHKPGDADKITDEQIREVEQLLNFAQADYGRFIEYYKVDDIAALTQNQFSSAMTMLRKKKAKNAKSATL